MKIFLTGFLLCFSLGIQAQDVRRMQIAIQVEPGISLLIFDDPDLSPASRSVHATVSGLVMLDLNRRFRAELGAGMRYMEIDQTDYAVRLGCDHDGNGGFDPFHSWVEVDHSLYYLSVPVGFRYRFRPEVHSLYVRGGASADFYLGKSGMVALYECGLPSTIQQWPVHQPERLLILGRLGIGYELKLREKLTLYAEPTISYSFSKEYVNSPVVNNSRFMTAGLAVGLMFF